VNRFATWSPQPMSDCGEPGRNGRVELVDFAAALDSDDRRTPTNYRIDALHVNAIGTERLAKAV
jgi:hypothetical protein